jgi:uncharacterized protein (TIGR02594 family)
MDDAPAEPRWLAIARAELGVRAHGPGSSNPRIGEYHAAAMRPRYDDKAPWCSSFLNWTLAQAGIEGTRSALARDWLAWGHALEAPVPGCIAVLWREDPASWKGHCGLFLRFEDDAVVLLGGNQLDEVREHAYPRACVLGYRWPAREAA